MDDKSDGDAHDVRWS